MSEKRKETATLLEIRIQHTNKRYNQKKALLKKTQDDIKVLEDLLEKTKIKSGVKGQ